MSTITLETQESTVTIVDVMDNFRDIVDSMVVEETMEDTLKNKSTMDGQGEKHMDILPMDQPMYQPMDQPIRDESSNSEERRTVAGKSPSSYALKLMKDNHKKIRTSQKKVEGNKKKHCGKGLTKTKANVKANVKAKTKVNAKSKPNTIAKPKPNTTSIVTQSIDGEKVTPKLKANSNGKSNGKGNGKGKVNANTLKPSTENIKKKIKVDKITIHHKLTHKEVRNMIKFINPEDKIGLNVMTRCASILSGEYTDRERGRLITYLTHFKPLKQREVKKVAEKVVKKVTEKSKKEKHVKKHVDKRIEDNNLIDSLLKESSSSSEEINTEDISFDYLFSSSSDSIPDTSS